MAAVHCKLKISKLVNFALLAGLVATANTALAVNISIGIPGLSAEPKPTEFIGGIYNFALMISGVLALGAMVFGGVKYMTAAGNPSGQSEGREWIKGAVFGLLLLFGAYFILNVINPDLTKLSLPTLSAIPAPAQLQLENKSACNTCTNSQWCVKPNGSQTWACVNKNQPTNYSCDPLKIYPQNGCPADKQLCSLNIQTNQTICR